MSSEEFIKKNMRLSDQFERYVRRHDEVFKGKPRNPCFIIIDSKDKEFSKQKLSSIEGKNKCFVAEKRGNSWSIYPY